MPVIPSWHRPPPISLSTISLALTIVCTIVLDAAAQPSPGPLQGVWEVEFTPRYLKNISGGVVTFVARQNSASQVSHSASALCAFGPAVVVSEAAEQRGGEAVFACTAPAVDAPGWVPLALSCDAGASWLDLGPFKYGRPSGNNFTPGSATGRNTGPVRIATGSDHARPGYKLLLDGNYGLQQRPQLPSYAQPSLPALAPYSANLQSYAEPHAKLTASSQPPAPKLCITSVRYAVSASASIITTTARLITASVQQTTSVRCTLGSTSAAASLTPAAPVIAAARCSFPLPQTATVLEIEVIDGGQQQWLAQAPLLLLNTSWMPGSLQNGIACFAHSDTELPSLQLPTAQAVGLHAVYAVNQSTSLAIVIRDASEQLRLPNRHSKLLNVSLEVPAKNLTVPVSVALLPNTSSYLLSFEPSVTAPHMLRASYNSRPVSGLPASFAVVASQLQPSQWRVDSTSFTPAGGLVGLAGELVHLIVSPAAALSAVDAAEMDFSAFVVGADAGTGAHADVLQCKPAEAVAACTITLNLTASGAYLVDVLQEGLPVSCHVASPCSMPLALTILPQPAVTKLSYFAGPGSFTHIADQPLSIAMYLRDEHGNAASAEGASLMFQASDGSFIRANLTQAGGGSIQAATKQLTVAGWYTVTAALGTKRLRPSFNETATQVLVLPADIHATSSRLTGSVLASTATAGQLLGVAVTLADAYRNAVTDRRLLANVNVSLSLSGPQQLQVQLPLADTGFRFAASLQLNVSGQYNAALAVQSEPAAGWQLLITSGLPAAGVMAPSLQPLTAGTGSYIALQVSDSLGNAVVDPELDFSFTQLLGPQQLNFSSGLLWSTGLNANAQYQLGFRATAAGAYQLDLVVAGRQLPYTTASAAASAILVEPGELSPEQSTAVGDGLLSCQAGATCRFAVTARDAYGNALSSFPEDLTAAIARVQLSQSLYEKAHEAAVIDTEMDAQPSGSVRVSYRPSQAGNISISLSLSGTPIAGSPFPATVHPGPISAASSVITGPDALGCVAGGSCRLHVLPQDAFGNRRLAGDDSLLVSASNGSANVSGFDASEGFYTVSYMFPEPSKDRQLLQVSLLTQRGPVSIGSTALGVASPLKLHIVRAPGPAQASYCSAEGSGWNMLTAGAPGKMTVMCRDAHGIRTVLGNSSFVLRLANASGHVVEPAEAQLRPAAAADGSYPLTFTLNQAGAYLLSLYLGTPSAANLLSTQLNSAIRHATLPAAITVLPAAASGKRTAVSLHAAAVAAGQPVGLSIMPRDGFGNALLPAAAADALKGFEVAASWVNGSLAVALPLTVNESTQQLQAQAGLTVAGVYKLQASLNGVSLKQLTLKVTAAKLHPERCSVTGPNALTGFAGVTNVFDIALRDAFSNAISPAAHNLSCSLSVSPSNTPDTSHGKLSTQCKALAGASSFTGAFYSTAAGGHAVAVTVASPTEAVQLPSFAVSLEPGTANASRIHLVGWREDVNWTAGVPFGPFSLEARDGWGNAVDLDCGSYTIALVGLQANASLTARAASQEICTVSTALVDPGMWQLHISLGAKAVAGSPFELNVLPAPVDPARSYVVSTAGLRVAACTGSAACPPAILGAVGEDNTISVAAINILGEPYTGDTLELAVSIKPVLPPDGLPLGLEIEAEALAVSHDEGSPYDIIWSASNLTLYGKPLRYNVSIAVLAGDAVQAISSSPLLVDLTAGPADASFTAAVSSACPSNTPNSLLSLSTCVQITTQDAYGNAIEETSQQLNITAQVVGPPGVQPTYTILQHQNTAGKPLGSYLLVVHSAKAGAYDVQLYINDVMLPDVQTAFVQPGPAQLNRCSVQLASASTQSDGVIAGDMVNITLAASDKFGNLFNLTSSLLAQQATFQVVFTLQLQTGPLSAFQQTNALSEIASIQSQPGAAAGNSTIAVSDTATVLLTPKLAGRLIVRAQLTVNSSSSSFSSQSLLTVAPGPVQLDQTVVMGPGATGAVAGNAAVMVVLMQDRWGNTVAEGCQHLKLNTSARLKAQSAHFRYGACLLRYTAPATGHYTWKLLYRSKAVPHMGGTLQVIDAAGPADPDHTLVLPHEGGRKAVAGVPSQLQLLLADSQRIGVTSGGAVVTARLWQGPAFVPASIMDHSNGSVSIDFLLQAQGDYLMEVKLNGQHIYGPATWTCIPGQTSSTMTQVQLLPGDRVEAAQQVSVTVLPQDAYRNRQQYGSSAFDAAFLDVDGRILLLDAINQTLAASFNLSLPGEYPLTVWLQSPAGSAAAELLLNTTLHVAAGRPLLSNTAVYGNGSLSAQAGVPAMLYLQLRDAAGNAVTDASAYAAADLAAVMYPVPESEDVLPVPVSLNFSAANRAFLGSYTPAAAAVHVLSITSGAEEGALEGLASVAVQPGPIDAVQCLVTGLDGGLTAGNLSLQITPRDTFGNAITADPEAAFSVILYPDSTAAPILQLLPSFLQWQADSSRYAAALPVHVAGSYSIAVQYNFEHVYGLPFQVQLAPGEAYAATSTASGDGLQVLIAGQPGRVAVQAADMWGNTAAGGFSRFWLAVNDSQGSSTGLIAMQAQSQGLYTAEYTVYQAGYQSVSAAVLLDDSQGVQQTVTAAMVSVVPSAISFNNSFLRLLPSPGFYMNASILQGTAGLTAKLQLALRDAYGNAPLASNLSSFNVTILSQQKASLPAVLTEQTPGNILARFRLLQAGSYVVEAALQPPAGRPAVITSLQLKVQAASISLAQSAVHKLPSTTQTGQLTKFAVAWRDAYRNPVSKAAAAEAARSCLKLQQSADDDSAAGPALVQVHHETSAGVNGSSAISFTATLTGQLQIDCCNQGQALAASNGRLASIRVVPGAPARAVRLVQQPHAASTYLILQDAFGNRISSGNISKVTAETDAGAVSLQHVAPGLWQAAASEAAQVSVLHAGQLLRSLTAAAGPPVGGPVGTESPAVQQAAVSITAVSAAAADGGYKATAGRTFLWLLALKPEADVTLSTLIVNAVPSFGVNATLQQLSRSSYLLSCNATTSGSFTLMLSNGAHAVASLPISILPEAAAAAAASIFNANGSMLGSGNMAVQAGLQVTLYVQLRDSFRNVLDHIETMPAWLAATAVSEGEVLQFAVQPLKSTYATHRLTLTATRAGHYNLSILLNGAAIGTGKPARLTVLAAEPDAAGTQLAAAVAPAAAGSPAAILFRPFDRFKNLCTSSALAFTLTAACTQPAVTVQGWVVADAEEQGLYRGTFTATAAGVYTVRIAVQPAVGAEANSSSSSISSNGASLLSVLLTVAAGPPLPYRSTAQGAGLWAAAVGLPSNFSVMGRDLYGNPTTAQPAIDFSHNTAISATEVQTDAITTTYIPSSPGTLKLAVNFSAAARAASVHGGPFRPVASMAPAPQLLSAQLDSSLALIALDFDQATNQGSMGTSLDCARVLDAATVELLGAGPLCRFTSSAVLTITLGSEASIQPVGTSAPDALGLLANAIGSAAGNSFNASGHVLLQPPAVARQPLAPTAVINAPAQVGACEEVLVDACQSGGSGGRSLQFSFGITSEQLLAPDLLAAMPQATNQCSFALPWDAMQPGSLYNISVTVQNFLGLHGSAVVLVAKLDRPAPTVRIPGGDLTVLRSWTVILSSIAAVPSAYAYNATSRQCLATSRQPLQLGFEWSADPAGPNFAFSGLPSAFAVTQYSPQLALPPNYLQADQTYVFHLTAFVQSAPFISATARVEVTVQASPLELYINGGASRVLPVQQNITIQAVANDPDNSEDRLGEPLPFLYAWSAIAPSATSLAYPQSQQLFTAAALQAGAVSFAAGELSPGSYTLVAQAVREPIIAARPPARASVTLSIVNDSALVASMHLLEAGDPANFPVSTPLVIQCEAQGADSASTSFQWALQSNAGLNNLSDMATSPAPGLLYIAAGRLMAASQYQFICTASSAFTIGFGQATLMLNTAAIPTSGVLDVALIGSTSATASYDAVAALDSFMLTARDWVGEAGRQLQYEFRALQVTEAGEAELPLAAPTVANWLQVRLPPGNVSVVVYVRYADSASSSPLGLPAGARLQAPILQMQPLLLLPAAAAALPVAEDATPDAVGRRLLLHGEEGCRVERCDMQCLVTNTSCYPSACSMSEPDLSLPWSAAAAASREAADALLPKAPAFARHSRQLRQLSQSQGQSALDVANMLLDSFEQVVANGDGSSALVLGAIFGQTFTAEAAAISADPCTQDGFIAAARERIITRLNGLDATTYPSTAYLLQSSCAFADLANVPADLTLAAAQAVGQFVSAHVDALLTNQWQGYIAPLPTGDPFECFARGVNGVLERLSAECSSGSNSTLDWASAAALQSVANLGLAVASLQPLGSSPWTYSFPFYSIQALSNISTVNASTGMVQLLTGQRSIDTSPTSVASVTSLGAEVAQQAGASPGLLTGRGSTSLGGSSYLQGVLLATSQLQLPNGDKPVSQLAGAFSSAPTAGRLLFTLPEEIPEGAAFAAWRWDSSSASGSSDFLSLGGGPQRRRLLQDGSSPADPSPPLVINSRTVAVDVADIGGFYYLTGGQATARPASQPILTTAGKAAVGVVVPVTGAAIFMALGLLAARIAFVRRRVKAMTIHPIMPATPVLARRSLPAPDTGRFAGPGLTPLSRSVSAPSLPSPAWFTLPDRTFQ